MLVKAVKELGAWSYMETILARSCRHALDSALAKQVSGLQNLVWNDIEGKATSSIRFIRYVHKFSRLWHAIGILIYCEVVEQTDPHSYPVSCQLVAALLTSAMESLLEGKASTMESKKTTTSSAGNFCKEIVSLFIEPAMALLSQPMNSLLRHQAMFILLPPILKAIRCNVTSNSSEELETAEARWESGWV